MTPRPPRRSILFRVARATIVAVGTLALGTAAVVWWARGPSARGTLEAPPAVAVSEERLRRSVETLAQDFRTRWLTDVATLDGAARWVTSELDAAGLEVSEQAFDLFEGTFRNVVGVLPGTDPEAPILLLGAHYDAYGEFPGADDNASGVAALIELARTLPPGRPERTIHFVAFTNEEPPFFAGPDMGSERYAQHLEERGVDVDLMVSIEMVGYFSDEPGSQRYPVRAFRLAYPSRGDFIAVVGDPGASPGIRRVKRAMRAADAIPVLSFRAPTWVPGIDFSDHRPFRARGIQAVMVTDTAFMRNPHYHARTDTPDTLDYRRMAAVVRALHGVVRDAAGWRDGAAGAPSAPRVRDYFSVMM